MSHLEIFNIPTSAARLVMLLPPPFHGLFYIYWIFRTVLLSKWIIFTGWRASFLSGIWHTMSEKGVEQIKGLSFTEMPNSVFGDSGYPQLLKYNLKGKLSLRLGWHQLWLAQCVLWRHNFFPWRHPLASCLHDRMMLHRWDELATLVAFLITFFFFRFDSQVYSRSSLEEW